MTTAVRMSEALVKQAKIGLTELEQGEYSEYKFG
jgi:hypothetical protein